MVIKRRSLVLSTEGARHPFRCSLPAHVLAGGGEAAHAGWRLALTRGDWAHFLGAYCASFVAVSAFIA